MHVHFWLTSVLFRRFPNIFPRFICRGAQLVDAHFTQAASADYCHSLHPPFLPFRRSVLL
ncbi:hypothetical protein [Mitsuokella jalaludinii]|uniref:hypothetical protein n=1 Tax=Mitsuokella jalaludinii TaxID=187979 RepID=UPI001D00C6FD|nr:hypothetical protein [Mitsuokella jalaludinii]MCB5723824.1 hypothetical protein [Mitsuokella jalaludinii]